MPNCLSTLYQIQILSLIQFLFDFIEPPRIELNPQFQVVRPGDDATISCSASGEQPIEIAWAKQVSRN